MLNKVVIMGRLTKDPELRHTQNGTAVASFSMAVERDFKDASTGKREADFFDVVAWRQTGEFVSRYFKKGRMAVVEGRLQARSWKDGEGNNRRTIEIVADHVYFGDSKDSKKDDDSSGGYTGGGYSGGYDAAPANTGYSAAQSTYGDFAPLAGDDDGELPF